VRRKEISTYATREERKNLQGKLLGRNSIEEGGGQKKSTYATRERKGKGPVPRLAEGERGTGAHYHRRYPIVSWGEKGKIFAGKNPNKKEGGGEKSVALGRGEPAPSNGKAGKIRRGKGESERGQTKAKPGGGGFFFLWGVFFLWFFLGGSGPGLRQQRVIPCRGGKNESGFLEKTIGGNWVKKKKTSSPREREENVPHCLGQSSRKGGIAGKQKVSHGENL